MTLLCLIAMWLAGFGLVRWMFPQPVRLSLRNVLLFSVGIGAGGGMASCLYFVVLVLAGPSTAVLAWAGAAVVAIALALGLLARPKEIELNWAEDSPVPWYLVALFLLAVALAVTMFLGAITYNPHGEEGAWSIWNLKARFLFRAGSFWRDAFSRDLAWTHPDYPLFLPGLVALLWKLAGQESTDVPIAIAFLFGFGTTGVLVSTLGVLRGKTYALLAGMLLLATATFIALSAALYGDVPLSFYILSTLALLFLQDRYPDELRFSVLAGLMAGFAAWTRNEGLIFLVAVIVARVYALFRFGKRSAIARQMVRFLAGLAVPLAVVIAFKLRVSGPSDVLSTPASAIWQHVIIPGRWIMTLEALVIALFTMGRFLIPMVLALALYWYLVRFHVDARDRGALATAGIALSLTLVAQLLVDVLYVNNLPVEISTSLERILLQIWPAGLLMFFLVSGPLQMVAVKPQKKVAKDPKLPKEPNPKKASRRIVETR
jgi:hypothetical protein